MSSALRSQAESRSQAGRIRTSWTLRATALLLGIGCARLEAAESAYTPLDLKACSRTSRDIESATWRCRGVGGIPVLVSDSDARMTVSYGAAAEREPAARAWFGPLNGAGPTIEWRSEHRGGAPHATILRWSLSDPEGSARHSVLVVTRLPPGPVCHVAYVDAEANPDANALARQAADESARAFRCGIDTVLTPGRAGRGVALIRGSP